MSYSFSDGCGSCSTVGGFNEMPANQVNFVDPGSQMVSQLVVAQQQAQRNATNSQQMHHQEQQMIDAQVINAQLADAFNDNPPVQKAQPKVQVQVPNVEVQVKKEEEPKVEVKKEVKKEVKEESTMLNKDAKTIVMIGLVIAIALGWNETAKYHINQAIKYNDGSPYYYAGYVGVMILLALAVCNYFKKN